MRGRTFGAFSGKPYLQRLDLVRGGGLARALQPQPLQRRRQLALLRRHRVVPHLDVDSNV